MQTRYLTTGSGACTVAAGLPQSSRQEIVMNPIRPIRRVAGVLAGLACAWLGLAVAAPAAFAVGPPPPVGPGGYIIPSAEPPIREPHPPLPPGHFVGPVYKVPVPTVVAGGMPGWQIALIALGAALAAATAAVLLDRARAARRKTITAAA
jgi:ABC-type Co2+ transport system permease subunit